MQDNYDIRGFGNGKGSFIRDTIACNLIRREGKSMEHAVGLSMLYHRIYNEGWDGHTIAGAGKYSLAQANGNKADPRTIESNMNLLDEVFDGPIRMTALVETFGKNAHHMTKRCVGVGLVKQVRDGHGSSFVSITDKGKRYARRYNLCMQQADLFS